MVEGTGLENQRWQHPQVRILSFPPRLDRRTQKAEIVVAQDYISCPFFFLVFCAIMNEYE